MTNDLTFSGNVPVVINRNGSASDIFAPVRSSSCDINIVSPELLTDLYTAQKDDVKVRIEKEEYDRHEYTIHHPAVTEERLVKDAWDEVVNHPEETVVVSGEAGWDEVVNHPAERSISYRTITPEKSLIHPGMFTDVNGVVWRYGYISGVWTTKKFNPVTESFEVSEDIWDISDDYSRNQYWSDGVNMYRLYHGGTTTTFLYVWKDGGWDRIGWLWDEENKDVYMDADDIFEYKGEYYFTSGRYFYRFNRETYVAERVTMQAYSNVGKSRYFHPVVIYTGDEEIVFASAGKLYFYTDWYYFLTGQLCSMPINTSKEKMFKFDDKLFVQDTSGKLYYYENNNWTYLGTIPVMEDDVQSKLFISNNKLYYGYGDTFMNITPVITEPWTETIHHPDTRVWETIPAWTETIHHNAVYEDVVIVPAWTEPYVERTYKGKRLVWEGYMTPNTYTQELTQNLDEIALTCIDPVALLKYVTLDMIMTRPNVVTYGEIIGKALAYVKIDVGTLMVEQNVWYNVTGSSDWNDWKENNPNGVLDFKCQVSNFWDEAGEPATLYDVIAELLRPFGLCLVYAGDSYRIYDVTKPSVWRTRDYNYYKIAGDGRLTKSGEKSHMIGTWDFAKGEWKSNNITEASMSISETYDKITGVASTNPPSYSTMAFDKIDYNQRDLYDAGWLNVQRNKSKGYNTSQWNPTEPDTRDYWFYLWNGAYVNPDYGLESVEDVVSGYMNINNAYNYLTGQTGHPTDHGSILNFYGGANNPTGTGKEQNSEKSVEVKKRITAYEMDNGKAPEFLERSDIRWKYDSFYGYTPDSGMQDDPCLIKEDWNDGNIWGRGQAERTTPLRAYHQEYPNMTLIANDEQIVDISLTQSYSRTGIDAHIDIMSNSIAENRSFIMKQTDDNWYDAILHSADVYYFPTQWDAESVIVDSPYFTRYSTSGKLRPVWDRRKIYLYVKVGYDIYQFNGKEWVVVRDPMDSQCFYLKKLMNYEKLFHTDMKYDVIETADGSEYALNEDGFTWRKGSHNDVVKSGGSQQRIPYYLSEGNDWLSVVSKCSEGNISVILPSIDATNATIYCDVFCSSMLGITGNEVGYTGTKIGNNLGSSTLGIYDGFVMYENTGTAIFEYGTDYEWSREMRESDIQYGFYGKVLQPRRAPCDFMPASVTYVKAEHLDLSIEVTVPESNLGQMFGESDIKYTLDLKKNYLEQYEGPTFKVNTYHPLVGSSFSYLIFDNEIADPDKFIINSIPCRPECFVVQAYMNYFSKIRRVYNKTIVPAYKEGFFFDNTKVFITTPEMRTPSDQSPWLYVVADSEDLKTNRHTIEAVEDYDMNVDEVKSFGVIEIPRKSRNERWNYVSTKKN